MFYLELGADGLRAGFSLPSLDSPPDLVPAAAVADMTWGGR